MTTETPTLPKLHVNDLRARLKAVQARITELRDRKFEIAGARVMHRVDAGEVLERVERELRDAQADEEWLLAAIDRGEEEQRRQTLAAQVTTAETLVQECRDRFIAFGRHLAGFEAKGTSTVDTIVLVWRQAHGMCADLMRLSGELPSFGEVPKDLLHERQKTSNIRGMLGARASVAAGLGNPGQSIATVIDRPWRERIRAAFGVDLDAPPTPAFFTPRPPTPARAFSDE